MRPLKIILILSAFGFSAIAQPVITPVNFLNTEEPERMCQSYIDDQYGLNYMAFLQPTGGAVMRIDKSNHDHYKYIFCDRPFNRLLIFSLDDYGGERVPAGVKEYGRQIPPITFRTDDSLSTVTPPFPQRDSVGCFSSPVDVVVSSKHGYFEPEKDYVYVLDQGNLRIVQLSYDPENDSLMWEKTFGEQYLDMPTALDYAAYNYSEYDNHDIYVTDGVLSKVFRFSAKGDYEADFGSWGYGLAHIGYPTGIAVAPYSVEPNSFYISDSKNHRVTKYHSESTGPIYVERRYIFSRHALPDGMLYIKGIDVDTYGNVYVIDNFNDCITVLSSALDESLLTYARQPESFDRPNDIYIDNNEMTVFEHWGEYTGINSFVIQQGSPKAATNAQLPVRFYLYQNYPNPFNSSTIIKFDLPVPGDVLMTVYNILGQKVIDLENSYLPAGTHYIHWDGRNASRARISSGVYFYRIEAGNYESVKKLLLLK
jgi:hypothetical protein